MTFMVQVSQYFKVFLFVISHSWVEESKLIFQDPTPQILLSCNGRLLVTLPPFACSSQCTMCYFLFPISREQFILQIRNNSAKIIDHFLNCDGNLLKSIQLNMFHLMSCTNNPNGQSFSIMSTVLLYSTSSVITDIIICVNYKADTLVLQLLCRFLLQKVSVIVIYTNFHFDRQP